MTHGSQNGSKDDDYVELSPDDPDWDLSEEAGYSDWEPRHPYQISKWLIVVISLLIVAALTLPLLLRTW
jgi:hypothetical protein